MCDTLEDLQLASCKMTDPLSSGLAVVISEIDGTSAREAEFPFAELQQHTILVSEAVVGTPDDQTHEELGGYEAHAAVQSRKEQYEQRKLRLLFGEAHRLHTKLTSNRILVKSGEEHVCSCACTLTELRFQVFSLARGQCADRLHVCLGTNKCTAREAFHLHPRDVYSRVLFVCEETNAVHLCTADTCNSATIDKDTFMCCALTGNVHSKSQTILSHGWVEDEWRKGVDPRIKPVAGHDEVNRQWLVGCRSVAG
jgi:hypothetical protein